MASEATDMRCGFDRLAERVKTVIGENPQSGHLASLTSSCRRHEMDPQLYFTQLLMNLPSWPANDLDAWLPIAGSKLTPTGARLWKYLLSIPEN
jgi:hypothetical protein